jgi:hypothetical protein
MVAPAAVNLCASLVGRDISEAGLVRVMALLRADPACLRPGPW